MGRRFGSECICKHRGLLDEGLKTTVIGPMPFRHTWLCLLEDCYPAHRVGIRSELVMLGDLDGDNRWASADMAKLDTVLKDPFAVPDSIVWRCDMNQNGI